jgi:hypothetical protein
MYGVINTVRAPVEMYDSMHSLSIEQATEDFDVRGLVIPAATS